MTVKKTVKKTKAVVVKKEVVITEKAQVAGFISEAIASKLPVEQMKELFELQKRVKSETAREEFVKALASFQGNCPVIIKTKEVLNKDGRSVRYKYAPLESIVSQIKSLVRENGLSYTWDTLNIVEPKEIKVIITLTHVLGHSKSSEFTVPIDAGGYMTAPQKVASAVTFAKRYTLCNVFGIATGDEDTDASDVAKEKLPRSIKAQIAFLLKSLGHYSEKSTAKEAADSVLKLTGLDLIDENLDEIKGRLEILVNEYNESKKV